MSHYREEEAIRVALLCTVYIVFLIIKFIHNGKIKFFCKAFPNIFIVIFLYDLFTISTAILTFLYYPLAGSYVAPNLTKEKIMSLKRGDDIDSVIKSLGLPVEMSFPNREVEAIKNTDPEKKLLRFTYAFRGRFYQGFQFYVHFMDDKVTSAIIKRDSGNYVYGCGQYSCPKIFDQHSFDEFFELSKKSNQ